MGGGTKSTSDVQKGKPFDLLEAIAEASKLGELGSVAQAAEFCTEMHTVPFRVNAGERPAAGTPAHLVLADSPLVLSAGNEIGVVDGPIAIAMRGCLTLGYEMSGTIESFDAQRGRGVLSIAGTRRQVA